MYLNILSPDSAWGILILVALIFGGLALYAGGAQWLAAKAVAISRWRPSKTFWFLTGLMAAMLVSALDGTMFNTALATIVGELHGVQDQQWVGTIYLFASLVMLPIYGKLGDYFSRKKLILGALVVFLAGSVVGGLAPNMMVLIIGRGIQGIGAGGMMTLVFTLLAIEFSPRERLKYSAVIGSVFGLVSVVGPFVGGLLTDAYHIGTISLAHRSFDITTGWRWAFWLNIPLGLVAIVLVRKYLRHKEQLAKRQKVDVAGIVLLTSFSTLLVLASSWGGSKYAWGSWQILTMVLAAFVVIGIFIPVEYRVEKRGDSPFIPMSMFKNRDFTLVTVAGVAVGVAMFGVIGYMPTYIQMVTGFSPSMSGVLTLPMMVCMLLVSTRLGKIINKVDGFKYHRCPPIGIGIMVLSLFLLGTMTPSTPVWLLCTYLGLMGIGLGMSMQLLVIIGQNSFDVGMMSTVTGVNQYFRQAGSTFGMSGTGSLFVSFLAAQFALFMPGSKLGSGGGTTLTPAAVQHMPPDVKAHIILAYNNALTSVFHIIVWVVVAAFFLTLFLSGKPLRKSNQEEAVVETIEAELSGAGAAFLLSDPEEDEDPDQYEWVLVKP